MNKTPSNHLSMSRRGFMRSGGAVALQTTAVPLTLVACGGDDEAVPISPVDEVAGTTAISLTQGTNLAASVSPDGKTIAMDLQGILWTVPIGGGTARRLTGYFDDIARPHWSPDGKTIAFQSYRTGNFHIWLIDADGSNLRQLTHGSFDHREPRFSPDGTTIACSSDRSGAYAIYAVSISDGNTRLVIDTPNQDSEPVWSPDGAHIAFSSNSQILVVSASGGAPEPITAAGINSAPMWTNDGRGLIYFSTSAGKTTILRSGKPVSDPNEDIFSFPISWISDKEFLYTADGHLKKMSTDDRAGNIIPFSASIQVSPPPTYKRKSRDFNDTSPRQVKGIASLTISPDGTRAAFAALNQIYILDLTSGTATPITNDDYYKCHPAWAPDGERLAYSCDRNGKLDIWEHFLSSSKERQITNHAFPCVSARWSPDGSKLACLDNNGNVLLVDSANGQTHKLIGPLFTPGRPDWSPDGSTVILSAIRPYSARYREGISVILTINASTGSFQYTPAIADRSLGPRGDDGPVWGPNNNIYFTMQSLLWKMKVNESGIPTGAPQQINNEVTDAVSVSKNGKVLYLNNGTIKIWNNNGPATPAPLNLTWTLSKPKGTTVIRAGKLWDGRSNSAESDVDIIVHGNRITAIEPHQERPNANWIDASSYMVMPGLMEMHSHIQGKHFNTALGDREGRIFLTFGITTTRGLAELAYHSAEHKEAIDSGARVAPRHFSTGEAFDGTKIYYDVMRAIYDDAQLERELERAVALDYDLVKCYVRMPLRWQQRVIEVSHQNGIPATSHYLFPWIAFGGDGQEHMGATSRFGYSRTISPQGKTYQDVIAMYGVGKATRTPTIFGLNSMAAETPSLIDEDRMRVLWPDWQYSTVAPSFRGNITPISMNISNQVLGVKALVAVGAQIMQGTDFYIVAPAFTLHLNLRAMVKGGMSVIDALKSATSIPGDFLAQGHGAIEVGSLADMIFVAGNPLERIEDVANIRGVVLNGKLHTMESLIDPFRNKAAQSKARSDGKAIAEKAHTPKTSPKNIHNIFAATSKSNQPWWHNEEFVVETMKMCCVQIA